MTLHTQIIQKLERTNHDELLKTMGYYSLTIGHRTLQKFLETDDIYIFLKNGSFDMKYTSEQFLQHLLKALDLTSESNDELKQYKNRLDAIRSIRNDPYIYVDTHFKRKGEPIFALAMMGHRRCFRIDKELLVLKSESEVFDIIVNIVKKHYLESEGKLPLWGKIYNYVYHHTDGIKYIFDVNGRLCLNHHDIAKNRAELRLGNQIIGG